MDQNLSQVELQKSNSLEIKYAGFGVRFGAWFFDGLLLIPFVVTLVVLRALTYGISLTLYRQTPLIFNIIIWIMFPIYNFLSLVCCQTTLGKNLFRLKVTSVDFKSASWIRIVLREIIGKYVSSLLLGLGYFWIIFDPKKQAFHDKIAGTVVIKTDLHPINKPIRKYILITIVAWLLPVLLIVLYMVFKVGNIRKSENPCKDKKLYKSIWEAMENRRTACSLSLRGDITYELPQLKQMPQLRNLSLSGSNLTEVPQEVTELNNLLYLELSNNKLSELPPEIENLKNLRNLILAYNNLSFLPIEITNLNYLEMIDLSYNQFTKIPPELAILQGKRLKTYAIVGNPLQTAN